MINTDEGREGRDEMVPNQRGTPSRMGEGEAEFIAGVIERRGHIASCRESRNDPSELCRRG